MKKKLLGVLMVCSVISLSGCDYAGQQETGITTREAQQASRDERQIAQQVQGELIANQPIPTDIQASLERHNIIRRSYWINGMRERAMSLPNPVADPPLGYITLFAPNGGIVGSFHVEGKVTSLNYSLVPYSEYAELVMTGEGRRVEHNRWLANPGGVYGTNSNGVFWFSPCGLYFETTLEYIFTDFMFPIEDPILVVEHMEGGTIR